MTRDESRMRLPSMADETYLSARDRMKMQKARAKVTKKRGSWFKKSG